MTKKRTALLTLVVLFTLIFFSMQSALTSGNSVPPSRLGVDESYISINDLAPPECDGLDLTNIIVVTGWLTGGTNAGDLILGRPSADYIFGGQGEDCIVGGGGNDSIYGSEGANDVCIGGPGNDSFPNFFIILPVENGCETRAQ
jgi:Ca2+-binding RTX toxin-like protein